jgi:tetratricopeptide (TPR) repeat protein
VDREFAVSLLIEGDFNDKLRAGSGLTLFQYFEETLKKYPDLLKNQETLKQAAQEAPPDFLRDVLTSIFSLDLPIREKMQDSKNFQDKEYLAILDKSIKVPQAYTRYALTNRAADYFAAARKPRAEWKKLDDLSAQLAEFDLRCAAGDYDAAASVLGEINYEYLFLWGHCHLTIQLLEKLQGNIKDPTLNFGSLGDLGSAYYSIGQIEKAIKQYKMSLLLAQQAKNRNSEGAILGNLGVAYSAMGEIRKSIDYYEQAKIIACEVGNKINEGIWLSNLGNSYSDLGDIHKAIEYYEQAMVIAREIGDRRGESYRLHNIGSRYADLGEARQAIGYYEQALKISRETVNKNAEAITLENLGLVFLSLGDYRKAEENYRQAIQIADEISFPKPQNGARSGLAEIYLSQNDLVNARVAIEAALQYDVNNDAYYASALHGIIALRQGDEVTARGAFLRAIGQADEILSKTAEYYDALDAKGLALCGLALCAHDDGRQATDDGQSHGDASQSSMVDGQSSTVDLQQAIETFRKARKIAPHAGVVKSVLRLFDELVKCEGGEILKDVRKAVEGIE